MRIRGARRRDRLSRRRAAQRAALDRRSLGVPRPQRQRHDAAAGGRAGSGRAPGGLFQLQLGVRRHPDPAQNRDDGAALPLPLRDGEAGGGAVRPRLRARRPPRGRRTPVLQRLRAAAEPLQRLCRGDPGVPQLRPDRHDRAGQRRRRADPGLHLRGQRGGGQLSCGIGARGARERMGHQRGCRRTDVAQRPARGGREGDRQAGRAGTRGPACWDTFRTWASRRGSGAPGAGS